MLAVRQTSPGEANAARKVHDMAGQNVVELTEANWEQEVVKSDKPVLVDFWAAWCGPCRALGPTIDKLATQYAGKLKVGKLNTDDNPDVAAKYRISGIPALLFFKGSAEPTDRLVGLQPESALVKVIDRMIQA
jgi:thioredoxin 1